MAKQIAAKLRKLSRFQWDDKNFAAIFSALGEPTRVHIMEILPREAICEDMYNVIELAQELGLTQPTVSHHLKLLRTAGLVKCRRQCNSVYFYVNQSAVRAWLNEVGKRFGCESGACA